MKRKRMVGDGSVLFPVKKKSCQRNVSKQIMDKYMEEDDAPLAASDDAFLKKLAGPDAPPESAASPTPEAESDSPPRDSERQIWKLLKRTVASRPSTANGQKPSKSKASKTNVKANRGGKTARESSKETLPERVSEKEGEEQENVGGRENVSDGSSSEEIAFNDEEDCRSSHDDPKFDLFADLSAQEPSSDTVQLDRKKLKVKTIYQSRTSKRRHSLKSDKNVDVAKDIQMPPEKSPAQKAHASKSTSPLKGQALKGQALKGQALKGQALKGQALKGHATAAEKGKRSKSNKASLLFDTSPSNESASEPEKEENSLPPPGGDFSEDEDGQSIESEASSVEEWELHEADEAARKYQAELQNDILAFQKERARLEVEMRSRKVEMDRSLLLRMMFFVSPHLPLWTFTSSKEDADTSHTNPSLAVDLPMCFRLGSPDTSLDKLMMQLWSPNAPPPYDTGLVDQSTSLRRAALIKTEVHKRSDAAQHWATAQGLALCYHNSALNFKLDSVEASNRLARAFPADYQAWRDLTAIVDDDAAAARKIQSQFNFADLATSDFPDDRSPDVHSKTSEASEAEILEREEKEVDSFQAQDSDSDPSFTMEEKDVPRKRAASPFTPPRRQGGRAYMVESDGNDDEKVGHPPGPEDVPAYPTSISQSLGRDPRVQSDSGSEASTPEDDKASDQQSGSDNKEAFVQEIGAETAEDPAETTTKGESETVTMTYTSSATESESATLHESSFFEGEESAAAKSPLIKRRKKVRGRKERSKAAAAFLEEEAELSGDDIDRDGEDEDGSDGDYLEDETFVTREVVQDDSFEAIGRIRKLMVAQQAARDDDVYEKLFTFEGVEKRRRETVEGLDGEAVMDPRLMARKRRELRLRDAHSDEELCYSEDDDQSGDDEEVTSGDDDSSIEVDEEEGPHLPAGQPISRTAHIAQRNSKPSQKNGQRFKLSKQKEKTASAPYLPGSVAANSDFGHNNSSTTDEIVSRLKNLLSEDV